MGIVSPVVVSPIVRATANVPELSRPLVLSEPADVPVTVRRVLPLARPVTVRSLRWATAVWAPSRRVTEPETSTRLLTELVVLSNAGCAVPAAFFKLNVLVMVIPKKETVGQVIKPVAAEKTQFEGTPPCSKGRPPPTRPPMKSSPNPPPMKSWPPGKPFAPRGPRIPADPLCPGMNALPIPNPAKLLDASSKPSGVLVNALSRTSTS